MRNTARLRLLMLAALVAVMLSASGCASVGHYFEHRYRDFTRMIDLGVTVSTQAADRPLLEQPGARHHRLQQSGRPLHRLGRRPARHHSHVQPLLGAGLRRGDHRLGPAAGHRPPGRRRSCGGAPASSASRPASSAGIRPETVTATGRITRRPACISSTWDGSAWQETPATRKSCSSRWAGSASTSPAMTATATPSANGHSQRAKSRAGPADRAG